MIARLDFSTPQEALREMVAAGAVFALHRSTSGLGYTFSYRVANGGDVHRCSDILACVKSRPPVFLTAFKAHVHDAVTMAERGAA